jgi:hypothetical protein
VNVVSAGTRMGLKALPLVFIEKSHVAAAFRQSLHSAGGVDPLRGAWRCSIVRVQTAEKASMQIRPMRIAPIGPKNGAGCSACRPVLPRLDLACLAFNRRGHVTKV